MKTRKQDANHRVQILAAQKGARDHGLKWNQERAAKGDVYALLRMGERYRDGEGVPKDLTRALQYFTKASAAGSLTAAEALLKLNQTSASSPAKT